VREVLERIEAMPEQYGRVWRDVRAATEVPACRLLRRLRGSVRGAGRAARGAGWVRVAVASV